MTAPRGHAESPTADGVDAADEPKALTLIDVEIAEGKIFIWLHAATALAALLTLAAIPAITAAMIPSAVVGVRQAIVAWRRLREMRRRHGRDRTDRGEQ